MPLPLPHIKQKLHRSHEHIVQVQKGVESIIESIPHPVVSKDDPQAVAELLEQLASVQIPDPLQIVAGEAIHQSRSALDHFAAQLAGCHWHRGTEFPIQIQRPTEPNEIGRFEGKIKGFLPEVKALVKRMQPYEFPPDKRADYILTILKHLNNRDKHRTLLETAAVAKPRFLFTFQGDTEASIEFTPDDDTDPAVPRFESAVDVHSQLAAAIVFPQFGSARNYPVVEGLSQLRAAVIRIIDKFRHFP